MIKPRFYACLLITFPFIFSAFHAAAQSPEIRADEIGTTISKLASFEYEGRKPGSKGDSLTQNFILNRFSDAGLKLMYQNGLQRVKIVTGYKLGPENSLSSTDNRYILKDEFEPLPFTGNKSFDGPSVFVGFGLKFNNDSISHDDYSIITKENQWFVMLDGLPSALQKIESYKKYADLRSKVLTAIDHQAKGIIIIQQNDTVSPLSNSIIFDKNSSQYEIPIIMISWKAAKKLFVTSNKSTNEAIQAANQKDFKPINLNNIINGQASVFPDEIYTSNCVALLPGNDAVLGNEYLVVGAHHDHLGFGGKKSGSRMPDTTAVHFGADDNASGVAAVIELAEKLASEKSNKRSIIFATFGAEELGLIGSKAFVADPPTDLKNITFMLNFDMVGRLDSASNLTVGGVGTSLETRLLVDSLNTNFKTAISEEGYGPSDHASFYAENIPVIYFTSGVHEQYHTPFDTFNRINLNGEKRIIDYAATLIREVANRNNRLTYRESGPKNGGNDRTALKVTLGIMPDFTGAEKSGLRVDGVTPGKAAAKYGLKKGDIITSIDGKKVSNIYDYMNRMKEFSSGQIISVDILRDGKTQVILITL